MSEGHHHHGGDASGGIPPGMLPPSAPHHHDHHHQPPGHLADPSDPMWPDSGRRRPRGPVVPLRRGSVAWVTRWVLRLVIIAFIVYVAFQVFHGVATTP
jgi:hypothetical protein